MIRLNQVKLPLDHAENALQDLVLNKLSINEQQLVDIHVFKRGYDARKRNVITLIYTLDITLKEVNEAEILARFEKDQNVRVSPDTNLPSTLHRHLQSLS